MECFVDIETRPTTDPEVMEEIANSITPPKNMSKPETIAKWMAEDKPGLIEDAIAKTSLDGAYGKLCCISYAFGDAGVKCAIDRNEKLVLEQFFRDCVEASKDQNSTSFSRVLTMIGHNIHGFDMRFMWQRSIVNGIKPSLCLPWNSKPWGEALRDTMLMWNPDKDKRISLHKLCHVFGIESPKDKNGIDGSNIAELWKNKQYEKIANYAKDDVDSMRQCYRKMSV